MVSNLFKRFLLCLATFVLTWFPYDLYQARLKSDQTIQDGKARNQNPTNCDSTTSNEDQLGFINSKMSFKNKAKLHK
ncbi:hypothetical protein VSAK1_17017 [Vibrio mediterranei AK1]|nr:hypothetical protein VSAK1_17017 [Vibrio mediterranei AK1]